MKAAWIERYGPPETVRIREIPRPEPRRGEVLVAVRAACVSSGDRRIRAADFPPGFKLFARAMFGLFRPRRHVLGTDFAGEVAGVGAGVARYRPGQRVLAFPGARMGGHAEFVLVKESAAIAELPDGVSYTDAAAIAFGGATALYFLRDRGKLGPGERVLVLGAAGAVGSAAVQIARALGARVTGVGSAANRALVTGLGAEDYLAYDAADPAEGPPEFDLILDTQGKVAAGRLATRLRPGGRLALLVSDAPTLLGFSRLARRRDIAVLTGVAPERSEDLATLLDMLATGTLRPLIDSSYPLEDAARAHARVDIGHKRGAVLLTMSREPATRRVP